MISLTQGGDAQLTELFDSHLELIIQLLERLHGNHRMNIISLMQVSLVSLQRVPNSKP